tara:strand:- start:2023 stop:2616 length:594 start_codon:yes stop_codon:yes gene_type:complete
MPSKAKIFSRLAQNVDLVGGVIKIDTVSLSNASMDANTQMAGVNLSNQTVPVGTIQSHSANTAPSGWLICDGSPISRTTYSDLYSIVGTTWGSGDGSTTFTIPDFRGWFMRGLDGGSGIDPDAGSRTGGNVIGSSQNEEFKSHYHYWVVNRGGNGGTGRLLAVGDSYNFGDLGVNTDSRGGNETRSKNKAVLFCIKY